MILGITGSYGTGKSTVAKEFARLGAKVIDADKIVHTFIKAPVRKKLAKIVFKKKAYLDLICRVVHPLVIKRIKQEIKRLNPKKNVIVIDAPLLVECGIHKIVNKLIVVKTTREVQLKRLRKKTGFSKQEIQRRISFQMPLSKKMKLADFIIDNNKKLKSTRGQIREIWKRVIN